MRMLFSKTSMNQLKQVLGAAILLTMHAGAGAQGYPVKPITVIEPFPSGGAVDAGVRAITEIAAKSLGQPMVIDARPGAGTRIGTEAIIRAPRDGYTIGVAVSASGVNIPALDPKVTYDPLKDFTFLSLAFEAYFAITTHPSVAAKSLNEFISMARAKPGGFNYATSGVGTSSHVWVEVFQAATGTQFTHVPYKGEVPGLQDLLGGQVQFMFASTGLVRAHIEAGKLNVLAITSPEPLAIYPKVPTAHEAGVANFRAGGWVGFVGPAGLPAEIANRLSTALREAQRSADVRERLAKFGFVAVGLAPAEFAAQAKAEIEKFREVNRTANIKME
ncbi:MAG: tripartite tricarboxylate transporter substrate binding protein [Betaproteobacteria bacterium]|nr:tripartite tricarboxylate transporter substrate binding protein [Betaproteobacteria bacterium]